MSAAANPAGRVSEMVGVFLSDGEYERLVMEPARKLDQVRELADALDHFTQQHGGKPSSCATELRKILNGELL